MVKPIEICNYSSEDVDHLETVSFEKLPSLHEEYYSGNISDRFSFTSEYEHECEPSKGSHTLDALFRDTTSYSSYEHKLQELADIESEYIELIKPPVQSDHDVSFEASGWKLTIDEVSRLNGERFTQSRSLHDRSISSHSDHPFIASVSQTLNLSTSSFSSYEDNLQKLADIESEYFELIKPTTQSDHDEVNFDVSGRKLSTDEVIRLGAEQFIKSRTSSSMNDSSISNHPYNISFSGLSDQEVKDVELIENLLLSAEKVDQRQFERSSKLLDWCDALSCRSGSPIQKISYYFTQALREKIDKESRRITFTGAGTIHMNDIQRRTMTSVTTLVSIYQKLPVYQAGQFSGVQALVDRLYRSKKVHVIDLSIRHGEQSTILMQALASQPDFQIQHLKITAVGTSAEQQIKQTGDRLTSFAKSINLSFSFKVVIVKDMLDFNKDLLKLDRHEALGVYSSYGLWSMIAQQDRLESLMKVIQSIKPRVMAVCEVAVNLNSPNFVDRFIEALFHYGAGFDCLEDCTEPEDENRHATESMYLGNGIRNVVAAEGAERVIRHVNIDVWRMFFKRFGMKEVGLSMSSLYQAKLVVQEFSCGSSCTLDMVGNSLIIGWKGTPIQCVSAWRFSRK